MVSDVPLCWGSYWAVLPACTLLLLLYEGPRSGCLNAKIMYLVSHDYCLYIYPPGYCDTLPLPFGIYFWCYCVPFWGSHFGRGDSPGNKVEDGDGMMRLSLSLSLFDRVARTHSVWLNQKYSFYFHRLLLFFVVDNLGLRSLPTLVPSLLSSLITSPFLTFYFPTSSPLPSKKKFRKSTCRCNDKSSP